MTETQKRIKAYQKALPHMKERVMAVALLFVMSITMMASASFAWITLSRNPEISGLATTFSSNGSLEIALSGIEGLPPEETKIGDGSGDVTKSNLTWGNLINLSDQSYGLSDITLRPATLNKDTLANKPMSTVEYGEDGRVGEYYSNFSYTNYDKALKGFVVSRRTNDAGVLEKVTNYGVRAISSVTFKDLVGESDMFSRMVTALEDSKREAIKSFQDIYDNTKSPGKEYMSTVGSLISIHVDVTLNGANANSDCSSHITTLNNLINDFKGVMTDIGQNIVDIANLYYFYENPAENNMSKYTFDDLTAGRLTSAYKGRISCLEYYLTAWNKTKSAASIINGKFDKYQSEVLDGKTDITVPWDSQMIKAVDYLCSINTATLDGYTVAEVSAMASDILNKYQELLALASDKNDHTAVIHNGALQEASQLLNTVMYVKKSDDIRIKATVTKAGITVPVNIAPSILTEVDKEGPFLQTSITAVSDAVSEDREYKGDEAAADTYAMVLDFWVRTNSASSLLKLEGKPLYRQQKGSDGTNEVGLLYKWTTQDADGQELISYVYKKDGKYYINNTAEEADPVPAESELSIVYETKPYAYEGVNRVWDELVDDEGKYYEEFMPSGAVSTTQGTGSCYVFYYNSPDEKTQCLKLLSAMRVAFIDEENNFLASAELNTDIAVEDSGRVVVPLQLLEQPAIEIDDEGTVERYYITPLQQNEPKRITAIVYLEGSNLSNSDVLSAGSITGQLNIQFGSSDTELAAVDDKKLMEDYFNFAFTPLIKEFDEDDTEYKFDLSLTLETIKESSQPSTVKGNFVSVINASQGARQPQFTMTREGNTNKWKTEVEMTGPGNYKLLSIQIDGVDYMLKSDQMVVVTVPGISIRSLSWDIPENTKSLMTASTSFEQTLSLELNSAENKHHSVKGVFIGDNGQNVTVNFTSSNGTDYTGSALFTSSGKYELTYIYIDNVITPLSESQYKTINLQLGLTSAVGHTSPYIDAEVTDEEAANILEITSNTLTSCNFIYNCTEPLKMNMWCTLADDGGNAIENIDGTVHLYYTSGNSSNRLHSEMVWNADKNRYEGTFQITKNGRYVFEYIQIVSSENKKDNINVATASPVISSNSPDPMEYVGLVAGHQTVVSKPGSSDRFLSIALKKADAAVMNITVAHDGVEYTFENVTGVKDDDTEENVFKVNVSNAKGFKQYDGEWSIVAAEVSSVNYGGKFYDGSDTEDGWLDLSTVDPDLSGKIKTEFINNVIINVSSASAEGDPKTITFNNVAFMAENKVNDIVFTVTDYKGRAFGGAVNAQLAITYRHGGYNLSGLSASSTPDAVTYNGTVNIDANGAFTVPELIFTVDGKYKANTSDGDVVIIIKDANGGQILKTDSNTSIKLPEVSVKWVAPSVSITGVNPSSSMKAYNTSNKEVNVTNSKTATSATVYHKTGTAGLGGRIRTYYGSDVTISISNSGYAKAAELKFIQVSNNAATNLLFESIETSGAQDSTTGATDSYDWSTTGTTVNALDGECKRYVGAFTEGYAIIVSSAGKKTPAGEIKATQLVVTAQNGVKFTFTIPTITINNPY